MSTPPVTDADTATSVRDLSDQPGTPWDEAALLAKLKQGDEAAYELLVHTLTGRLLAVARRISRTESDAEDAVQEAFLSAFKAIADFDGRSKISTWLHRIVVNCALMKARKAAGHREASVEELMPQFENGLHRLRPTPWRDVSDPDGDSNAEDRAALWQALGRLPDEFRQVIVLKEIEGMSSKAVAESLGITDALVRQRLHRGRQALMKLLAPMMQEARA